MVGWETAPLNLMEDIMPTEKKTKSKEFNDDAYNRSMAYGDKHEVAIEKGWGKKEEGKSKKAIVDPEI